MKMNLVVSVSPFLSKFLKPISVFIAIISVISCAHTIKGKAHPLAGRMGAEEQLEAEATKVCSEHEIDITDYDEPYNELTAKVRCK